MRAALLPRLLKRKTPPQARTLSISFTLRSPITITFAFARAALLPMPGTSKSPPPTTPPNRFTSDNTPAFSLLFNAPPRSSTPQAIPLFPARSRRLRSRETSPATPPTSPALSLLPMAARGKRRRLPLAMHSVSAIPRAHFRSPMAAPVLLLPLLRALLSVPRRLLTAITSRPLKPPTMRSSSATTTLGRLLRPPTSVPQHHLILTPQLH